MKAKIIIPKGWRRLRLDERPQDGDMFFSDDGIEGVTWQRCTEDHFGVLLRYYTAIRKVKSK